MWSPSSGSGSTPTSGRHEHRALHLLADFGQAAPDEPEAPVSPEDAAYARGRADGRAEAEAEVESWADALEQAFQKRLDRARARWVEEEGARLATALTDGLAKLEARIGDQAAAALTPFLADAARARALDGLTAAVRRLSGTEGRAALRIDGPADLVEAIRTRLDPKGPRVTFRADDSAAEVTVTVGDTRLSTAIGAWKTVLEQSGTS